MELKGSKTEKNLQAAFAGESQARNKYTYYASVAKKAGYDIKRIMFLHLSKLGKEPKIYEYPVDDSFFLSVYRVFKHFFEGKKWII